MKEWLSSLLLPKAYQSESPSLQSQVKTSNGLVLILCIAGFIGISINLVVGGYQRIALYLLFYPIALLVIYLNKLKKEQAARILLAFYPGVFLFSAPALNGMVITGDREGYFLVLFMFAMFPLILFSDAGEKKRFFLGCFFYATLIGSMDIVLHFQSATEQIGFAVKAKEVFFYGVIAAGFALKLGLKTEIETHLNDRNKNLAQQRDEIEVLLEEVQSQKEELSIQQETLFIQNAQLTLQRDELVNINHRLEKNNDALLQLASEHVLTNGNYEEALKIITQIAASTLNVSRVSVWEIRGNKNSIHCTDMYSLAPDQHSCGMELFSHDFPVYFDAIKANKTIVANDATTNIFTSEFKDNYLIPLQIASMLDSPFFIDGELKGIVCFEQQNEARKWTPEDILFSRAIADLIPLSYECAERKLAQKEIIFQNDLLITKQQEILELNEQLEGKVKQRTEQLELRNKLLEEYAFYNAHVLRAPLCSLQGLIGLSNHDKYFIIDEQYIHHLKRALLDMEVITKEVSEKLRIADALSESNG